MVHKLLIGKIAEQLKLKKLTYYDLAKLTGYSHSSITAFMCGDRESDNLAKSIANALKIKI